MVIAVLAIIWVVCLTPMMLRKLSERRFLTSVDSFHRQLRGLRRAYPRLAASAADHEAMLYTSVAPNNQPVASAQAVPVGRSGVTEHAMRRAQLQATRRRRVLMSLGGTIVGCLILGMIPALRVLWGLSLLAFAAAAGYLALLIYIHRRAVERRIKVVDIRDRRGDTSPEVSGARSPRRTSEAIEWGDDDIVDGAVDYDYHEIMAGGR